MTPNNANIEFWIDENLTFTGHVTSNGVLSSPQLSPMPYFFTSTELKYRGFIIITVLTLLNAHPAPKISEPSKLDAEVDTHRLPCLGMPIRCFQKAPR